MDSQQFDVVIIGAGLSGINAAYRLQEAFPGRSYTILEGRNQLGGTWSFFKYPGIRSDSDLFTFGFPWDPWNEDRAIATAPAILSYFQNVCARHGIDKHIKFSHRVVNLNWVSKLQKWKIQIDVDGSDSVEYLAQFVVMGTGYYDYEEGLKSEIPGLSNFRGQIVHPQFWPEDLDYSKKNVVIVGSGATAVTMLPAMHEKVEHITMLQRSPGYFVSLPQVEPINNWIRRWMPSNWANWILRLRYLINFHLFYYWCQIFPMKAQQALRAEVARVLPSGSSIDPHFAPSYLPWEQRMCVVPDGDFFKALCSGKASIATGQIDSVTQSGIRLKSGEDIKADIIVTATGLKMQFLGKAVLQVDGRSVNVGDKYLWRGAMLQDVPNLALLLGYTNASWTLGSDVSSRLLVRVLRDLERKKMTSFIPMFPANEEVKEMPMMNLKSNYVKTAMERNVVPKCADRAAWRPRRSYFLDTWFTAYGDISDGMVYHRN